MDQYLNQLQKLIGYHFQGTWLENALDGLLSKDEEDRGLDFEGMLGCGVPCDVEAPEYEPEDPYPKTSPAQLALHKTSTI